MWWKYDGKNYKPEIIKCRKVINVVKRIVIKIVKWIFKVILNGLKFLKSDSTWHHQYQGMLIINMFS